MTPSKVKRAWKYLRWTFGADASHRGLTRLDTSQPLVDAYFLSAEGTMAFIAAWKAGSITKLFQRVIKAL